ncbi:hypothetical protein BDZ88DRAFT_422277 [Geranomyces variabilis]|nr:hypothetical protein BDZ88DRAFT_422277 [Geranomyces variabilis]
MEDRAALSPPPFPSQQSPPLAPRPPPAPPLPAAYADLLSFPSDWPARLRPAFASLDDSLRCSICKDFFKGAQSLPCGHSFCSLCLRDSLSRKAECPACRAPTVNSTGDMRPNRVLDEACGHFRMCRATHLDTLKTLLGDGADRSQSPELEESLRAMDPTTSAIDVIELSDSELPPQRVTRMQTRRATAALQRQQPLMQTSDLRSTAAHVQPAHSHLINDTSHLQPQGDAIVTCPLCDKSTRARDMDRHMDSGCTMLIYKAGAAGSGSTGISSLAKFASSRRPPEERKHKPSIHYHGYKDKEIQRLLSVDMLSVSGDRNTLIRRHAEWTKRYNANIDEGGGKSHGQLAKELGEWERALAAPKVSAFTATPRHEETQQTVLEREEHSRKYADEFEKMVDGLKKRKRAKLEAATSADAEGPL